MRAEAWSYRPATVVVLLALAAVAAAGFAWPAPAVVGVTTAALVGEDTVVVPRCGVAVVPLLCDADAAQRLWVGAPPELAGRVSVVLRLTDNGWSPALQVHGGLTTPSAVALAVVRSDNTLAASLVRLQPQEDVAPQPPQPHGAKQVAVLVESDQLDNLSTEQKQIVASLAARQRVTAAGHLFVGVFDPDQHTSGRSRLPAWLAQFVSRAKEGPLLVFAPRAGGEPTAVPLPKNIEAVLEAVR